jgi:phosphatidylglycerol lysyltransferase
MALVSRGKVMFALAHHKNKYIFTIIGRSILAATIALLACANIMTVLRDVSWDNMLVAEPLIDLGGPSWERAGLIITGTLLLLIARALLRGKRQAWWLSVGFLTFSLTSVLITRSDHRTMLLALGLLILLVVLAPLFSTRSDARASRQGYAALVLGIGCVVGHVVLSHLWRTAGRQNELIIRHGTFWLLHLLTFLILVYGVGKILGPVYDARSLHYQERAHVSEIVRRYGKLATVYFAQGRDKSYFWSETEQTVIAYRVIHGVALILGDPIGPQEEHAGVVLAFLTFCRRQDWPVALYQASAQEAYHLCCEQEPGLGLHALKIGEEALINVANFTLQGKRGAPVRHSVARAKRAGLFVQCWHGEALPEAVFAGMQEISAAWLNMRKIQTQMGFSMGHFPDDWSEELLTVVAFNEHREVEAFLTWTPLYASNGWALDAMRRGNETTPGTMELLIAHTIEWAGAMGYKQISLGLAPLAGLDRKVQATPHSTIAQEKHSIPFSLLERSAAILHQKGMVLGDYRSLYAFKTKFQPTWETRYLIISEEPALPRILLALFQCFNVANPNGNIRRWLLQHLF